MSDHWLQLVRTAESKFLTTIVGSATDLGGMKNRQDGRGQLPMSITVIGSC